MLKRHTVWMDTEQLKRLERIGKNKGGLKVAQLIRVAVHEYIQRESKENK